MEQKESANWITRYITAIWKNLIKEVGCIDGKPCYFDDSLCMAYRDGFCKKDSVVSEIKELRYEGD